MKRIVVIILALVMVIGVSSCGIAKKGAVEKDAASKTEEPKKEKAESAGTLGDYEVAIKSADLIKEDGEDILLVTFDFTNNGESAESFYWAMNFAAFQDGIELSYESVYKDPETYELYSDSADLEVQPGKTIEVQYTYLLRGTEDSVKVEVSEFLGEDDKTLSQVFEF